MSPLLKIEGLRVTGRTTAGDWVEVVKGVDLEVWPGEVVALIGESGAGKSTVGLACLGYVRPGCRVVGGRVLLDGVDILSLDTRRRLDLRGRRIAYIAQSAAAAFNASLTVGYQVTEPPLVHNIMSRSAAGRRAIDLYRQLQLPSPETIGKRFPHQVSGGQLQRLMAAMAMSCGPELLVLDEPTTAIDVTTQVEVLAAFKTLIRESGTAAVYITHDLAVVAQMADRSVVLHGGEIVEQGPTEDVLRTPRKDYTRMLLAAVRPMPKASSTEPRLASATGSPESPPVLEVRHVDAKYGRSGSPGAGQALFDVTMAVPRGNVVGVIGESGSGKSTLARVIAGLLSPTSGEVRLDNARLPAGVAMRSLDQKRRIQIVFQMPDVSFNPRKSIGSALGRPLKLYSGMDAAACRQRVAELLEMVRLPRTLAERFPAELSGGEKQRVNLARALAAEPEVILCDEVTSALDTVVSASIIQLLKDLQRRLGHSYVFISHDLSTVAAFADSIVVLRAGRIVEQGCVRDVLELPAHPYTRRMISSVPELSPGWLERVRGLYP